VRALLLDLGNVLVAFDHDRTLAGIGRAAGAEPSALRAALFGDLEKDFDRGRLTPVEFFRSAERRAGLARLPDEVWTAAWRDIFTPIPEALALLPRLTVPAALVSNTNVLHWEGVLAVAPEVARLDALALSFLHGSIKPEPALYRVALERLGAVPGEAVFADDRPEHVEGARSLGIDGFLVTSPAALEHELSTRGLLGNTP
jgi:HAD superfamily hydrolase (TIGR01509 family)